MNNLSSIKAIIFDWDDTKVSTFHTCFDLFNNYAQKKSLPPISLEQLKQHWGKPVQGILSGLWEKEDGHLLTTDFLLFQRKTKFIPQPFSYTLQTVLTLKTQGYLLGVLSSSPRITIQDTIKTYLPELSDQYVFIHGSEDTPVHKPNPKVFDIALEQLLKRNITGKEVIYVGDGLNDFLAAKSRGLAFIAVTSGFTLKNEFQQYGLKEEYILPSLESLPQLLQHRI